MNDILILDKLSEFDIFISRIKSERICAFYPDRSADKICCWSHKFMLGFNILLLTGYPQTLGTNDIGNVASWGPGWACCWQPHTVTDFFFHVIYNMSLLILFPTTFFCSWSILPRFVNHTSLSCYQRQDNYDSVCHVCKLNQNIGNSHQLMVRSTVSTWLSTQRDGSWPSPLAVRENMCNSVE